MSDQLQLDPTWPGLETPADQLEVDVDALLALATKLETEADFLAGSESGTPAKLAADTNLPCASFGTWQTAYEMEAGHSEARHYVVHYFTELVELMRETARLAREAAGRHAQTDQALQQAFGQQQGSLDDRPVEVG